MLLTRTASSAAHERPWRAVTLGLLLAAGWLPIASGAGKPATDRIVAVGDVHGELEGFVAILRETGLIDAGRRWAGGRATLVQTGDFLDRGPGVRQVMDLLMDLQKRAPRHGGKVVVLLGNHEAFNLFGDYLDVAGEAYASFADRLSETRRTKAYRRWKKWLERTLPGKPPPEREGWMAAHPPGLLEYRKAMGPDGAYGRWLRTLPAAVKIGETIFVHGGISPDSESTSVEALDEAIRSEIAAFDRQRQRLVEAKVFLPFMNRGQMRWAIAKRLELEPEDQEPEEPPGALSGELLRGFFEALDNGGWFAFRNDSPVWFRGFAQWPEDEEGASRVEELLGRFGARHFVVGHTVQKKRIVARFGGRVFLTDTGMLHAVYRGRPAALEIAGGRFTAVYEGERTVLHPSSEP